MNIHGPDVSTVWSVDLVTDHSESLPVVRKDSLVPVEPEKLQNSLRRLSVSRFVQFGGANGYAAPFSDDVSRVPVERVQPRSGDSFFYAHVFLVTWTTQ